MLEISVDPLAKLGKKVREMTETVTAAELQGPQQRLEQCSMNRDTQGMDASREKKL